MPSLSGGQHGAAPHGSRSCASCCSPPLSVGVKRTATLVVTTSPDPERLISGGFAVPTRSSTARPSWPSVPSDGRDFRAPPHLSNGVVSTLLRWRASHDHLPARVDQSTRGRAHGDAASFSPRPAALRPFGTHACLRAERPCIPDPGRRLHRAQRRRAAADLRQVRRWPKRSRQAPDQRSAAAELTSDVYRIYNSGKYWIQRPASSHLGPHPVAPRAVPHKIMRESRICRSDQQDQDFQTVGGAAGARTQDRRIMSPLL
jgi:hypothetical protein